MSEYDMDYPRLVTNGKYYRIEISPGDYERELEFDCCFFETKSLWIAKRRLKMCREQEEYLESTTPDKWRPV